MRSIILYRATKPNCFEAIFLRSRKSFHLVTFFSSTNADVTACPKCPWNMKDLTNSITWLSMESVHSYNWSSISRWLSDAITKIRLRYTERRRIVAGVFVTDDCRSPQSCSRLSYNVVSLSNYPNEMGGGAI
jgi:ABC-type antimicrobial peptide transport system permease subunit